MVKLKNIVIEDSVIKCDIYPEDSPQAGNISVDISSKKMVHFELPPGYEWCKNHVNHAKKGLIALIGEKDVPREKTVMWY